MRHAIGVVGQKHGADREATGRENLVLQGELYGITGAELRRRVAESLERFGLADAADRQVKTYSGGMQRRLDVAMGLIHRPQVLFLDEPTTGLDPEARAQMWAEIERLAREEGMTILLTTHYLEEADRLASQLGDRRPRADRRARHAGRAQEPSCDGDTIQVELAERRRPAARRPRSSACPRRARCRSTGARCAPARATAAPAIPAVLAALRGRTGVRAAAVTLARPSLDDVYLRHAGRRGRPEAGGGGMTALRQTWQVTPALPARASLRQPAFLFITLVQPLIWLLLFGALFKAVTRDPGLRRRLLHRLPHARRRRDARGVERRLDRHGLHRGHQRRRDGPDARRARAGAARSTSAASPSR